MLDLKKLAISTSLPGLSRETFYNQTIYLPDLSEQDRIAQILDEADDLRNNNKMLWI